MDGGADVRHPAAIIGEQPRQTAAQDRTRRADVDLARPPSVDLARSPSADEPHLMPGLFRLRQGWCAPGFATPAPPP